VDIQSGMIALVILAVVLAIITVRRGLHTIQSARKMTFYHLRRQREAAGWRLLGLAVGIVVLAILLPIYGVPIAYEYFPPSPTPSLTPTITVVPTITLSPTITLTPTITDTPVVTDTPTSAPTPSLPLSVVAGFQSSVTPNPDAVFSPLEFSTTIRDHRPVVPSTAFRNPIVQIYLTYSYDGMIPGAQWTAIWYRDGKQICLETHPFEGGTGGYDDATCTNPDGGWLPGIYEVQLFVGEQWKQLGRFLVEGNPPTALPTSTQTLATTPTRTPSTLSMPTENKTPLPRGSPTP
jgi:hypothetical protein